ncbi:S-layer family protein [Phormidium tenue FACHB-886]|nr:S-layer family protein [Phormidium tenue FACHB-886]
MEVLLLRRQGCIFTDAGSNSGSGTGGNIRINSDFVIAESSENSDISADAVDDAAGNVMLDGNVLGIAPQERETPRSDITANSERGASGEIVIGQLQTDPTQGLVALPNTVFDASQFIAQRCAAGSETVIRSYNSFVVTGRGGLPPSPADVRSSDAVLSAWATVESERGHSVQAPSSVIEQAPLTPIVEAQGWIKTVDGEVELVSQAPASSGFSSRCSQTDR